MAWAPKSSFAAKRRTEADRYRGTADKRGYNARWQAARLVWLAEHPLCVQCVREGRAVAATDVDHIIPHRGNQELFWDMSNWQSLCSTHHKRKTASGQ